MSRPGDWNCRSCQHLNFQRRDSCQRCGDSKSGSVIGGGGFDRLVDYGIFGSRGVIGSGMPFGFSSSSATSSVAGPDVRPGDWYCISNNCGTHNFASRSTCFRCGAFKDELLSAAAAAAAAGNGFDCDMPSRSTRGYGFSISGSGSVGIIGGGSGGGGRSGWKSGDWICNRLGCNEHNFASRMECFRCNAPRGM